jgi:hypothetical protein
MAGGADYFLANVRRLGLLVKGMAELRGLVTVV